MYSNNMAQNQYKISRGSCQRYVWNALTCSRDVLFQLGISLRIFVVGTHCLSNKSNKESNLANTKAKPLPECFE